MEINLKKLIEKETTLKSISYSFSRGKEIEFEFGRIEVDKTRNTEEYYFNTKNGEKISLYDNENQKVRLENGGLVRIFSKK
jgi:hypothetical protein